MTFEQMFSSMDEFMYIYYSKQDPRNDDAGTIIFYIYTFVNILLVAKDWFKDVKTYKDDESESEENSSDIGQLILSNIGDVVPLAFMFIVCAIPSKLWMSLLILFVLFTLRECFQLAASFSNYFTHLENYIEFGITVCTAVVLFNGQTNHNISRSLAAFAIVLSWFELITLLVKHPRLTR